MFLNPHFYRKEIKWTPGSVFALPFGPQVLFLDAMIMRDQLDPSGVLSQCLFGDKDFFRFQKACLRVCF